MKVKFKKRTIDEDRRHAILTLAVGFFIGAVCMVSDVSTIQAEDYSDNSGKIVGVAYDKEIEEKSSSEFEIVTTDVANFKSDAGRLVIMASDALGNTVNMNDVTTLTSLVTTYSIDSLISNTSPTFIQQNNNSDEITEPSVQVASEDVVSQTEDVPHVVLNIDEETLADDSTNVNTESTTEPAEEVIEGEASEVVEETQEEPKPVNTRSMDLNDDEYSILCRIVEAEVTGSSMALLEAKQHVADCIMNRIRDSKFPNSVKGVVFQASQFSPISDGRYWKVKVTDTTREAVNRALSGDYGDSTSGALFFKKSNKESWRVGGVKRVRTLRDGVGHSYYR